MAKMETAIILGGGVGGLVAARELRKKVGKKHRVVLIDKEPNHLFTPSLLWLMTGLRKEEKIQRELSRLEKKGIEVVQGEITGINPGQRTVTVNRKKIIGDYLVISLGADLAPESVAGLSDAGHNFYTLKGACSFRDEFKNFREGKLALVVASLPYKCPAAPYEAALLLDYDLRKRKVRDNVTIDLFVPEPAPMGITGPEISGAVRKMVEDRGINYHPEHKLKRVTPTKKMLHFANGAKSEYDLLAYVPPHLAPPVVAKARLLGESGWIPVDRHTMETSRKGVYAIGDITGIPLKLGKPLPKAGTFAHSQAEIVAHNIACQMLGKGKPKEFDGGGECFIETGEGKAGFARGNFYGEPKPQIKMYKPGRHWHAVKVVFEKEWFRRWF